MQPRYARNIPALTAAECEILKQKRVLVVGCGGLGGHIIDQLTRIGIGAVRVVDGDVFEETNLNRQLLSEVCHTATVTAASIAIMARIIISCFCKRDSFLFWSFFIYMTVPFVLLEACALVRIKCKT